MVLAITLIILGIACVYFAIYGAVKDNATALLLIPVGLPAMVGSIFTLCHTSCWDGTKFGNQYLLALINFGSCFLYELVIFVGICMAVMVAAVATAIGNSI